VEATRLHLRQRADRLANDVVVPAVDLATVDVIASTSEASRSWLVMPSAIPFSRFASELAASAISWIVTWNSMKTPSSSAAGSSTWPDSTPIADW